MNLCPFLFPHRYWSFAAFYLYFMKFFISLFPLLENDLSNPGNAPVFYVDCTWFVLKPSPPYICFVAAHRASVSSRALVAQLKMVYSKMAIMTQRLQTTRWILLQRDDRGDGVKSGTCSILSSYGSSSLGRRSWGQEGVVVLRVVFTDALYAACRLRTAVSSS